MTAPRCYCTFRVDRLWLGVDVSRVQEVIGPRTPTRVPTAPASVRGLINLRGQIVTLLDLRERLGLGSAGPPVDRPMDVVVRAPGGAIGLGVDEVGGVVEVPDAALEPIPPTLPEGVRRLASGLYPSASGSLLVLDVDKVIT